MARTAVLEAETTPVHRKNQNFLLRHRKALVGVAVVGAAVYGSIQTDFFGRTAHARTQGQIQGIAQESFIRDFQAANPAGKYVLQFLTPRTYNVQEHTGGKGILGGVTGAGYLEKYEVGSRCLRGTAYDVGVSIGGAAVASLSPGHPDILVVTPANDTDKELHFRGLAGDKLTPADAFTKDELQTYGCSTESVPLTKLSQS